MTRKTLTKAVAATTLLALGIATANAFLLINPPRKWHTQDLPVSVLIHQGGESSVADSDNGVTAVSNALQAWEAELPGGTNLFNTGTTSFNGVSNDGQNTVSFNDPARIVRNAIAVTIVSWYDSGDVETTNNIDFGRYLESDMSFSKKLSFTTLALGSCNNEYDIEAVTTHEAGHALGLDHPSTTSAIMYASIGSCQFKRIAQDDTDGINTIYNDGYGGGTPCTATEARLVQHSCSTPSKGRNCLVIDIALVDDCGNPVAGVAVGVQLEGQEAGDVLSGSASTGSDGTVSFALRCRDADSSTYTSTILSVGGSLPWSPSDPDNTADAAITCPSF